MQQRSSLTVLVLLATAACAPEVGTDLGEDVASAEQEATLVKTAVLSTTTLSATALAATRPKPTTTPTDVCESYNGYTAAIASRTIDCTGTIGPDSFGVDGAGNLRRRFDTCANGDKSALEDIDSLLSLQLREKDAPEARRCIAGRWSAWNKQFVASGIQTCPVWKKIETINPPTPEGIKRYEQTLPELPAKESGIDPVMPHENYLAEVQFPNGKKDERCRDEADCAQRCISGFNGAFIEGSGQKVIIDPAYWLLSIDFVSTNPFMTPGYYHPMSYYGSLPGALYGHRHREGELCSRYAGGVHYLLTLVLDCLDPANPASCVTRCDEPTVTTTGDGTEAHY